MPKSVAARTGLRFRPDFVPTENAIESRVQAPSSCRRSRMAERKVLHSWKEIANYTGRGVRTIQRYEIELGFPIHRPAGKSRSAVLGFSDEIDAWLRKAPTSAAENGANALPKLTEQQIKSQRQYLAIAANARRNHESAKAAYEACERQAKRVQ